MIHINFDYDPLHIPTPRMPVRKYAYTYFHTIYANEKQLIYVKQQCSKEEKFISWHEVKGKLLYVIVIFNGILLRRFYIS